MITFKQFLVESIELMKNHKSDYSHHAKIHGNHVSTSFDSGYYNDGTSSNMYSAEFKVNGEYDHDDAQKKASGKSLAARAGIAHHVGKIVSHFIKTVKPTQLNFSSFNDERHDHAFGIAAKGLAKIHGYSYEKNKYGSHILTKEE